MSSSSQNNSLIAGIVVGVLVLSLIIRVCVVRRRRAATFEPPTPQDQYQQFPMNPRLNIPRQPSRNFGGGRLYQPPSHTTIIVQPHPIPNGRPSYPLHSTVTEPSSLSITPPTEPQPIHHVSEHEQPNYTLDLVQRMRKVQTMMADIQRLENESRSGVDNRQRIQELQRSVIELSDTTPATTTTDAHPVNPPPNLPGSTGTSEPPPAYVR